MKNNSAKWTEIQVLPTVSSLNKKSFIKKVKDQVKSLKNKISLTCAFICMLLLDNTNNQVVVTVRTCFEFTYDEEEAIAVGNLLNQWGIKDSYGYLCKKFECKSWLP